MNRRQYLTATTAMAFASIIGVPAFAQDETESLIPDMVLGDPDAPVEVIEYASFTCPHCANFEANQFKEIKANYIDTGKVRFVFREVYFDRYGLWASMIARCGGQMRFFGITEMVFAKQREWTQGEPAQIAANLRSIGKAAGLDDASLDACMQDAEMAQNLISWYETNAERDNIEGTPSFMIQGQKYSNMAYDDFAKILDEELEKAGWTEEAATEEAPAEADAEGEETKTE
ncbi:DsbA family protein [Marivivens aquimaris]|uniref:DsbA family protein n=1 Tax=Marivivens aquimaris TaxID=2774876 RepID=UPI0018816695|nr:DsbA family protein [Marivivens aquimaris]